jgi:membrane peptidoglycan carboxypeptidase
VALEVGPEKIKKVAERLGQPKTIKALPSLTLGGSEVTPLDMAASYGVFASGGTYAEPYLVTRIKDAQGKVVWQHDKKTRKAMEQKEAGVVNGILQRVVNEGTGKAAAIGRPVAGKTGTTNEAKDAWFVGYTPQLATAVWVGYVDEPRTVTDGRGRTAFGGGPPARIFSSTMRAALQGVKETPFQVNKPEDLGLKLPGATNGAPVPPPTQPPVNGAIPPAPPPTLAPIDTTPLRPPPSLNQPTLPPQTTPTTRPRPTTTRPPQCPTTTVGTPPSLPAGQTTTTARRPPGC